MIPNMEVINLKMELAKQKALNGCLQEEIVSLKKNYETEIYLLQETIEMQKKVLSEYETLSNLKNEETEILEESIEEVSMESELQDEAWDIITDEDLTIPVQPTEEHKIILDLSKEVDNLRISLSDAESNITQYQVRYSLQL